MKTILSLIAVTGFMSVALAQTPPADELEILRGNNLDPAKATTVAPGSAYEVEKQVDASIKQKCNKNGCIVFVDDTNGNEFRVGGNAGIGNNFNYGGIAIINPGYDYHNNDELQYSINMSFTHTKVTCRHLVPESVYRFIETYIRLISTPEFAEKVRKKTEAGEDMPMPEPVKLAFMTLASIKPNQGQCTAFENRGR